MILEDDGGRIAINPLFDKLITLLRTAVDAGNMYLVLVVVVVLVVLQSPIYYTYMFCHQPNNSAINARPDFSESIRCIALRLSFKQATNSNDLAMDGNNKTQADRGDYHIK
jgi:hypothetical protein